MQFIPSCCSSCGNVHGRKRRRKASNLHKDCGHVVDPARLVGGGDEPVNGFSGAAARANDRDDFFLGHHAIQPVTAQQNAVLLLEVERSNLQFD